MFKRRTVLMGLGALPLIAGTRPVFAQAASDSVMTADGEIGIHPLQHATFVMTYGDEVFYFDPSNVSFEGQPKPTAIFITHGHGDHFNAEALPGIAGDVPIYTNEDVYSKLPEDLKGQATALKNGDTTEVNGIPVEAVPAYNTTADRMNYHPEGVGNGYVLTLGDKKVYVAGDTEPTPEMLAMTGISVAFLPMNLPYTMDINQAAEAVKTFTPEIVIPYHYGDSDVDAFASMVGDTAEVRLLAWYPAG